MNDLSFDVKIKKLTVRVNCQKIVGSGIIYWPSENEDHCYVLTAKHCIFGKDFSNGAVATDILIDKLYVDGRRWESYQLKEAAELFYCPDGSDVAVLRIKKNEIGEKTGELPTLKFMEVQQERVDCSFRGYPISVNNDFARTLGGMLDQRDEEPGLFHIRSDDNFSHQLQYEPKDLVKGVSGSGVCINIQEEVYCYGIVIEHQSDFGRFLCIAAETIRKNLFPNLVRYHFEVESLLPHQWFRKQLERASRNLGPRFTPNDNYPVSLQEELDMIGRTERSVTGFQFVFAKLEETYNGNPNNSAFIYRTYGHILAEAQYFKLTNDITVAKAIADVNKGYASIRTNYKALEWTGTAPLLFKTLLSALSKFDRAALLLNAISSDISEKQKYAVQDGDRRSFDDLARYMLQITAQTDNLRTYITRWRELLNGRCLLISGPAGNGKSQLLAYTANQRMFEGLPSVLVLGQRLTKSGDPWAQVLLDLGLQCTKEEFLNALNQKGQLRGHRAILFIDALNEGQGLNIWPNNLRDFINTVGNYPWIRLVLSYRSSFKRALFRSFDFIAVTEREHHGFLGLERQAMIYFFGLYHISPVVDDTFIDNFKNPLFLKLFCQSFSGASFEGTINSSAGICWIFDQFMAYVNDQLADPGKFNYRADRINLVKRSVDAFVEVMLARNVKNLAYTKAFQLTETIVSPYLDKKGFINGLIDEEIFYENFDDTIHDEPVLDFSYEKFGDHLKAKLLLKGIKATDLQEHFLPGSDLAKLFDNMQKVDVNSGLLEAITQQVKEQFNLDLFDIAPTIHGYRGSKQSFIIGLAKNKQGQVSQGVMNYLKDEILSDQRLREEFWNAILPFSYLPGLHFNADYFHEFLMGFSMADRDAIWTVYLHFSYNAGYDTTPVAALVSLAFQQMNFKNQRSMPLYAKIMGWFLCSTNRGLRDDATKGLIRMLYPNLKLVADLLVSFEKVNDPYIRQRLFAVAYGCAVRNTNKDDLHLLGKCIYQQVFSEALVAPDILLRDYAREAIEWAHTRGVGFDFEMDAVRPPYRSEPLPATFPSNSEIDRMGNEEQGLKLIKQSMVTEYGRGTSRYGDFGRYVFGSAVRHWPNVDENGLSNLAVKIIVDDYAYQPDKHGRFDSRDVNRNAGRFEHRLERIGKKYQWIALYELLARLADNEQFKSVNTLKEGPPGKYNGPWEPFVRNIDPTLLKNRPSVSTDFWFSDLKKHAFFPELDEFLRTKSKAPEIEPLISTTDSGGDEWYVLQASTVWENLSPPDSVQPQEIWLQLRSYLVADKDAHAFASWAAGQDFMGRWMPEARSNYELFSREYFWAPAAGDELSNGQNAEGWEIVFDQITHQSRWEVMTTAVEYMWDSSNDNSRDKNTNMLKPAAMLMELMGLEYTEQDGALKHRGEVICIDPSIIYDRESCLLVRKKELLAALKKRGLRICWTLLGERGNSVQHGNTQVPDTRIPYSGAAYFDNPKIISLH